jgi:integrase/recombinase XerD
MSCKPHPTFPDTWIIRYYPSGRKKDPATGKPCGEEVRLLFKGTAEAAQEMHDKLVDARKSKKPVEIIIEPTMIIEEYKTLRLSEKDRRFKNGKGAAPKRKTINKELSYLSAIITWMSAAEQRYCPPLPFIIRGFPAKQVKAPMPVVPSREEMIRLLRASERIYRPLFALCYYAGLRKTEATQLKASNINWSQGYLLIKGKGGKERIVPIHGKLKMYLRNANKKSYLFVNPKTGRPWVDFKKALQRATDKAGLEQHVYMHLLRHGFGTHSIQSGINLRTLQMLMGHSSSQVTEMYTTLAAQFLQEEMKKFGRMKR